MIAWFARHQTAANLVMVAIAILGLVSLPGLQRATFPEIENDQVQIRVPYPGATAAEVEDAVCRRIEEALEGIQGLEETQCEAREGVGTATAVKLEGTPMIRFLDDVKSQIDAIDDFPEQTENALVEELGRTEPVISLAVTGPQDPIALKAYAENLKSRLLGLAGVANVTIGGFSAHHIRIEVSRARLRQYGLSAQALADAIARNSVSSPAGLIEGGQEDLLLRVDDQRKSVDDFRDLVVISGDTGASIRLGDITTISNRFEREENKVLFNGERAALLHIEKSADDDILDVYASVVDFTQRERAGAPAGLALTLTQDVASIVRDRLNMLVRNGAQGLLLVFGVLWLFFSLRYSLWVTVGLPISFLGTLFLLPAFGISLNMISMVGLLIGVGLLMDDAIVIAENIAARMAKGDTPMHAAIEGAREVMPGVLSSFATTVLVFGSLAFISGQLGQILRVMPIVLILVISVSLIEAFLVLPNHLGHSLAHMKRRRPARFRQLFEREFERVRERGFGPLLDRAVRYRYLTLGLLIMALMMAVAMPLGGRLKFVGFPEVDGDIVEARLLLPQGTPLARTEQVVARIETAAHALNERLRAAQPEQRDLVSNVTVVYGENPDAFETGPHVARVIADLLGAETRATSIDEFRDAWREAVGSLPDVLSLQFTEPAIGPGGRAIEIRLLGDELQPLKAAALALQDWLNGYAGVLDLGDDLRPGKREIRLRLNPTAGVLGLDASTLAAQVQAAFQGMQIDEFPRGSEIYEVELRLSEGDRSSLQDLENLTVVAPGGAQVPLPIVAEIEEVRGWARIFRVDGQRTVTVRGDVDRARVNARELIALAQAEFLPGLMQRYPGVRYDLQGEADETRQTGASIVRNVALGLLGVYLLLSLQFRGYLAPLTVMAVIPSSLIGVIFGHMALGLDLTMPSIVGMASLFGVVVNDSILLIVFIRQARNAGATAPEAATRAGRERFRPIVLTSITTIAGLLPLLAETSLQAQVLIPLAASLAFGLSSATLVALFLVPSLYCILDDFGVVEQLHGGQDEDTGESATGVARS